VRSLLYGAFLYGVYWVSCGWPLSRIWVPVIAALLLVTLDFFVFTLPRPRGLAAAQSEQRGWLTGFWTVSDIRGIDWVIFSIVLVVLTAGAFSVSVSSFRRCSYLQPVARDISVNDLAQYSHYNLFTFVDADILVQQTTIRRFVNDITVLVAPLVSSLQLELNSSLFVPAWVVSYSRLTPPPSWSINYSSAIRDPSGLQHPVSTTIVDAIRTNNYSANSDNSTVLIWTDIEADEKTAVSLAWGVLIGSAGALALAALLSPLSYFTPCGRPLPASYNALP
jgi:hypothetical protein